MPPWLNAMLASAPFPELPGAGILLRSRRVVRVGTTAARLTRRDDGVVKQPVAHVLAVALRPATGAVRRLRDRVGRDDRRRRVNVLSREHADRVGMGRPLCRRAI